ncbi:MAG: hypothetical protein K9H26_06505 [Prolixibacteraceae bacterium]|nr:hypothetical protein [Prolixibacteraceae bacterium]
MKYFLLILPIFILCCCNDNNRDLDENVSKKYIELTDNFSFQEFESVQEFVFENGDRQTYCNLYNDNPHFSFNGFEVYLDPETGQENMNCDPEISDFNQIVIVDLDVSLQYYRLLIVREGDLENGKIFFSVPEGIEENKIYLVNTDQKDVDLMIKNVLELIEKIKEEIYK